MVMSCLLISLIACTTPPLIKYEVVPVDKLVYVSIPESLTKPVDLITKPEIVDIIALGTSLKMCIARVNQANGRLKAISNIKP